MNESQHPQMSFRAATRDVIKQVETITGGPCSYKPTPVVVVPVLPAVRLWLGLGLASSLLALGGSSRVG